MIIAKKFTFLPLNPFKIIFYKGEFQLFGVDDRGIKNEYRQNTICDRKVMDIFLKVFR